MSSGLVFHLCNTLADGKNAGKKIAFRSSKYEYLWLHSLRTNIVVYLDCCSHLPPLCGRSFFFWMKRSKVISLKVVYFSRAEGKKESLFPLTDHPRATRITTPKAAVPPGSAAMDMEMRCQGAYIHGKLFLLRRFMHPIGDGVSWGILLPSHRKRSTNLVGTRSAGSVMHQIAALT